VHVRAATIGEFELGVVADAIDSRQDEITRARADLAAHERAQRIEGHAACRERTLGRLGASDAERLDIDRAR
jgi:hypothetical protein